MARHTVRHEEVPFSLDSDAHEGRLDLSLHGELDLACTDLLARLGDDEGDDVREVVVDIADLEFIDTAGIRALADVQARNLNRGRTVAVNNPTSLVRKVITLFGRSDMLPAR
jgi:anti-anti-sigma factor